MQHHCKHARILFTPDYQEHCAALDDKPQCIGCTLAELVFAPQRDNDEPDPSCNLLVLGDDGYTWKATW